MSKKESTENFEPTEALDVSEIIEPTDQFDLSALKSDIQNAEREAKEAINQKFIDQANFQKSTENIQQETEKIESFEDGLKELLEFIFTFANRPLAKVDVSQFDSTFIDKLVEKLIKLIPKDKMDVVQEFVGLGNKSNSAIQLLKISRFLMFISKEIFKRFDEYDVHRKAHDKQPLKMSFKKKDKEA